MKKQLKVFFKISLLSIFIFIVIYNLLLSDFNPMFNRTDFKIIVKELKKSKEDNFDEILEIYNLIYYQKSIKSVILNSRNDKFLKETCPCLDVARTYGASNMRNFKIPFVKVLYTLKIESQFKQEDCLKFLLRNDDFLYGNIGIRNASKYFYKKDLRELNEKEKLVLIIMLENPSLYNPIKNRPSLERRLVFYQNFLKEKNVSNKPHLLNNSK